MENIYLVCVHRVFVIVSSLFLYVFQVFYQLLKCQCFQSWKPVCSLHLAKQVSKTIMCFPPQMLARQFPGRDVSLSMCLSVGCTQTRWPSYSSFWFVEIEIWRKCLCPQTRQKTYMKVLLLLVPTSAMQRWCFRVPRLGWRVWWEGRHCAPRKESCCPQLYGIDVLQVSSPENKDSAPQCSCTQAPDSLEELSLDVVSFPPASPRCSRAVVRTSMYLIIV